MPHAPAMNGQVPGFPEYDYISGVPPIVVKSSICKFHNLGNCVQRRMEDKVEKCEPYKMIWYLLIIFVPIILMDINITYFIHSILILTASFKILSAAFPMFIS